VAIWAVQGDARVADLRIEAPGGQPLLAGFGHPTFERVQAIGASTEQACSAPIAPGLIRDSLCVNTGTGPALGFNAYAGATISWNFDIVNVTAIAAGTGTGANGIEFEASGNLTMSVAATNTVAQGAGTTADVHAANSGTGSVSIALDHSNFDLIDAGAGTSITAAGSPNNQTAPPAFVDAGDLDFHQRRASPTINAGTTVPNPGTLDFDRQPRSQGVAPDIGADEFDNRLKVRVKARKHQRARRLNVKVSCPNEECTVFAKGRATAQGKRFKLTKTKERFLDAGEQARLKLKAEHIGRLTRLLEERDGKARIKVKGTDAGGVVATKRKRVELVG
jgi:lipoprotein-anchoring transpeptidase ErfK/SrfK